MGALVGDYRVVGRSHVHRHLEADGHLVAGGDDPVPLDAVKGAVVSRRTGGGGDGAFDIGGVGGDGVGQLDPGVIGQVEGLPVVQDDVVLQGLPAHGVRPR